MLYFKYLLFPVSEFNRTDLNRYVSVQNKHSKSEFFQVCDINQHDFNSHGSLA